MFYTGYMNPQRLIRLLIGITLIVALPTIGCFSWYSMEAISASNIFLRIIVLAAYPAIFIALAFLVKALTSPHLKKIQTWLSALCLALALLVILLARTGIIQG